MKILIAEDDSVIRCALEYCLKKENHEVIVSVDGNEAFKKIEEEIPDLLITDIMMPHISGLELIQLVKEKYHNQIKIIVLTSLGHQDIVLESFSLGADDFLTKPFNAEELNLRVQRFL